MHYNGIDINDARINTKSPFTPESTCSAGSWHIDSTYVLAISIECPQGCAYPVRLSSIEAVSTGGCTVTFSDSNGSIVGQAFLDGSDRSPYHTAYIKCPDGYITGHIDTMNGAGRLLRAVATAAGGAFTADDDAFMLMSACCIPAITCGIRSFSVNGERTTCGIRLKAGSRVDISELPTGKFEISAYGMPYEDFSGNGITEVCIGGSTYAAAGKHLLIKPSLTSNLRIVDGEYGIVFKGVSDD